MYKWAAAFFIVSSPTALAFDILPEYQGLSETDLQKFERPADLDSEYQSLLNAYALPPEWDHEWQDRSNVMDFSVGSLSNKHFLLYSRLKVEADWLEKLRFRFIYFAQRDREVDQTRHILELSEKLTPWLRVAIYGEPSLYKRENDLGLALEVAKGDFSNRIYYTSHDLTRAEHNDQPDYFTKRGNPASIGWTGLKRESAWRGQMGFRIDRPVTWMRPREKRVFEYEKRLVFGEAAWMRSISEIYGARLQWDSTFKSQMPDSAVSPVAEESWRVERFFAKIYYHKGAAEDPVSYETGFMQAIRSWKNQSGRMVSHFNELPSFNISWRGLRRGARFDHLQAGYEMTVFNTFGDLSLTPPQQKHNSVENRLMTGYEFSFRSNAKLLLALNFDLDEFTPVPTFEGGSGQFRAEF